MTGRATPDAAVTVTVRAGVVAELERLVDVAGRSRSELAEHPPAEYLDVRRWQIERVTDAAVFTALLDRVLIPELRARLLPRPWPCLSRQLRRKPL